MKPILNTTASVLFAAVACHAHAAQLSDLQVVKNNLRPGLWSMQVDPYKVKGRTVTRPPGSGCVTVQQMIKELALPLSYQTNTKAEPADVPTIITKDLSDHGTVEVTIPGTPGLSSSRPTQRTLDIKMVDKDNFVFTAGPGNLTTTRVRYLGKCTP